jgi:nucleoid-associated protein YgaU
MQRFELKGYEMTKRMLAVVLILSAGTAFAQDKITREEYEAQMADYQQRHEAANSQIAQLDAEIAALDQQIAALDDEIAGIIADIHNLVGATAAEISDFGNTLDLLLRQLEGLTALAPEELVRHQGEVKDVLAQVEQLKTSKISAIPEMAAKILRLETLISDLQIRDVVSIVYEVERGDNLWAISADDTIYGDPYMWPRIYRANTEQISDPDMIYPKQKLSVPFGVSEGHYLVTRGDFLSKIAAAVYNDATMWHKIYKANMKQIVEPNIIFPAQVIEVPAN